MNLEDILSQIEADGLDRHWAAPLMQSMTTAVGRIATPVEQEPFTSSGMADYVSGAARRAALFS